MSLPVAFRPEARAEFDEAADWYEQRRPGKGDEFTTAVEKVIDSVAANPQIHARVFLHIRMAVVRRFPYCVFYYEEAGLLVVLSVFHTSRDPAVWKGRV